MLYLFNSAYRSLYLTNVLNTIFLPSGSVLKYRYNLEKYVHNNIYTKNICKQQTLITFIDRFGKDGYEYLPLRLGKLIKTWKSTPHQFFLVELGEFIHPLPDTDFNNYFTENLREFNLPKIVNNDPMVKEDGLYAFKAPNIFENYHQTIKGGNALSQIVNNLEETKRYKSLTDRQFLFLNSEIYPAKKLDDPISPTLNGLFSHSHLSSNRDYILKIKYFYPYQNLNPDIQNKLNVSFGEELVPLSGEQLNIDSYSNEIHYAFHTKRNMASNYSKIIITKKPADSDSSLFLTDESIPIKISVSRWINVIIFCLFLSYFIIEVSNGKQTFTFTFEYFKNLILPFSKTLVLFILFKIMGRSSFG